MADDGPALDLREPEQRERAIFELLMPALEDYLDTLYDDLLPPPSPTSILDPLPDYSEPSNSELTSSVSGPSVSVGSTGGPGPSSPSTGSEVCSGIYCDLLGKERDRI